VRQLHPTHLREEVCGDAVGERRADVAEGAAALDGAREHLEPLRLILGVALVRRQWVVVPRRLRADEALDDEAVHAAVDALLAAEALLHPLLDHLHALRVEHLAVVGVLQAELGHRDPARPADVPPRRLDARLQHDQPKACQRRTHVCEQPAAAGRADGDPRLGLVRLVVHGHVHQAALVLGRRLRRRDDVQRGEVGP